MVLISYGFLNIYYRSLQLENVRLENELNEASQQLEEQGEKSRRTESELQKEVNKLIDTLRDEKDRIKLYWFYFDLILI